jgi:hypothetical protein
VTLIAAAVGPSFGLAMAADSRTSPAHYHPGETFVSNSAPKLIEAHGCLFGTAAFARIGERPMRDLILEAPLAAQTTAFGTGVELLRHLSQHHTAAARQGLSVPRETPIHQSLIGRCEDGVVSLVLAQLIRHDAGAPLRPDTAGVPIVFMDALAFGVVQSLPAASYHLVGERERVLALLGMTRPNVMSFQAQDAVDFVRFCIDVETACQRFATTASPSSPAQTVGGPVEIALLDSTGVTWLARRELSSAPIVGSRGSSTAE